VKKPSRAIAVHEAKGRKRIRNDVHLRKGKPLVARRGWGRRFLSYSKKQHFLVADSLRHRETSVSRHKARLALDVGKHFADGIIETDV
jgi:hypothetical protein